MLGAPFADEYLTIAQKNACIDHLAALRADRLGQLPEYFLAVFLEDGLLHQPEIPFLFGFGSVDLARKPPNLLL